jgi:hypothetical protein
VTAPAGRSAAADAAVLITGAAAAVAVVSPVTAAAVQWINRRGIFRGASVVVSPGRVRVAGGVALLVLVLPLAAACAAAHSSASCNSNRQVRVTSST